MPTNAYLNLDNNDLKLRDLNSAVTDIISSGLSQITADTIVLNGGTQATSGKFRMNTVNQTIEYSADDGLTWTQLENESLNWNSTTVYSAGDVALYNGALYGCVSSNTNVAPAGAVQWRSIAGGVAYVVVTNTAQLADVLNHAVSDIAIRMQGTFTGTLTATCSAPNVAIYADETTVFGGSAINLTLGSTTNVYWYANGLRFTPGTTLSLNATGGTLWIDRARVTAGTLVLSGNIVYQRIDGNVSVDSNSLATVMQATWTIPGTGQYVEKSLTGLESKAYADELAFYVSGSTAGSGYIHANALLMQIAANAAKYFVINEQGPEADLPESAPEGYIYYTIDTGKLYKYGANGWEDPVQFRGPEGQPGSPGSNGSSPEVSAVRTTSGADIIIDGVSQAFIADGDTPDNPIFTVLVTTLSAGADATAVITGTYPNLVLSLGIPRGSDGSGGGGSGGDIAAEAPLISSGGTMSILGYPSIGITTVAAASTVVSGGQAYDLSGSAYDEITLTPAVVSGRYAEAWVKVLFGTSAVIASAADMEVVDTPTPEEYNMLHVKMWGTQTRVYVEDHWAGSEPPGPTPGSGYTLTYSYNGAAFSQTLSSTGSMLNNQPVFKSVEPTQSGALVTYNYLWAFVDSTNHSTYWGIKQDYDPPQNVNAVANTYDMQGGIRAISGASALDCITGEYNTGGYMATPYSNVIVSSGGTSPGPTPTSSVVYSMTLTTGQAYMPNVAGGYMTDGTQAGQNKYTNENGSYYMAYNSTSYKWFMYVASDNRACMSASASNAIRGNWTGEGGILAGGVQLTNTSMTITGSPSGDYYIDGTFVQNVMDMNSFENSVTSAVLTYDSSGTYGSSGWYILVNGSPLYMYSHAMATIDPAALYGVTTFNAPGGGTVQLTIQQA